MLCLVESATVGDGVPNLKVKCEHILRDTTRGLLMILGYSSTFLLLLIHAYTSYHILLYPSDRRRGAKQRRRGLRRLVMHTGPQRGIYKGRNILTIVYFLT